VIELSVVLPVYNEPSIEKVVREAAALVGRLAPGAGEVIVVNDGSTDGTGITVDALAGELSSVRVLHQVPNQGHGPALIRGFDEAAGRWIGHLDTDDQIPTAELGRLWDVRDGQDLVLGNRLTRHDPRHRLVLTTFVRVLVRVLAGREVKDANVPCKLFTHELWAEVRPMLSADTFAPSLALVILASRWQRPVRTLEVTHRSRSTGASSLHPARLASGIALATRQTVRVALVAARADD
jgi:glycosyltransferase involved in cell wall biosynthesis